MSGKFYRISIVGVDTTLSTPYPAGIAQSVVCWVHCPVDLIRLWASGRGDFPLGVNNELMRQDTLYVERKNITFKMVRKKLVYIKS